MLITHKNGGNENTIIITSSNISEVSKLLMSFINNEEKRLTQEIREAEYKKVDSSVKQSELNTINKVSMSVFGLQALSVPENVNKSMGNFDEVMRVLNTNTKNKFKDIVKSAEKEKKTYIKEKEKSMKSALARLKSVIKDKSVGKLRNMTIISSNEKIQFGGKVSDVLKEYMKKASSISFTSSYENAHKFETADYPQFASLLNNEEVLRGNVFEQTTGANSIQNIINKYSELCYKKNILNLLEEAKKFSNNEVLKGTNNLLEEKITELSKEVESLYFEVSKDMDKIKAVIKGEALEDVEKDIITKMEEGIKDLGQSALDKARDVADKVETKIEEKEIDSMGSKIDEMMEQKISELDDSLAFSAKENFVKFSKLPEEKQTIYKMRLREAFKNRMGESPNTKAIIDAKLEISLLDQIYGVKRDILVDVQPDTLMAEMTPEQNNYIQSYLSKLEYTSSEEMFKNIESYVKEVSRNTNLSINTASDLFIDAVNKMRSKLGITQEYSALKAMMDNSSSLLESVDKSNNRGRDR